jgi:RNA polymerase sigma factor (sigma-70 family)
MGNTGDSGRSFGSTRWSLILAAARSKEPGSRQALDRLCQQYWYPVYAFLRRHGQSTHDAEDLTQGFFADLLSRDWLAGVSAAKGKFRSFLLACLQNHISHVRARESGPTRHPGQPLVSIDLRTAEERYAFEPAGIADPAVLLERRLAFTLIDNTLRALCAEYAENNRHALFGALREHLVGDADRGSYAPTAARLGMTEGAVRVAVTRLRKRFRERLRAEVSRLVEDPRDVDMEIRHLLDLSRR